MATIKIEPITVTTEGGLEATITGIDPTSTDCFDGVIVIGTRWDMLGRARDNPDACNIDMSTDEMRELIETARRLGAPEA